MEYVSVGDARVPALGLGTYRLTGQSGVDVMTAAIEMGYRHLDTAEFYENQQEVGKALTRAPIERDEIFLTTKVWKTNLEYDQVKRSLERSLEALNESYVDLLLIHWPNERVPLPETIAAMNDLQADGKARHIGVSNFSIDQLQKAQQLSATPIFTNQVRFNPFTDQTEMQQYCVENGIMLTAHTPLSKGDIVYDSTLTEIGNQYQRSPAQVALRWLVQHENVAAIPKSSTKDHLAENFDIFDFTLSASESERIEGLMHSED